MIDQINKKVLIIEDDLPMLNALVDTLETNELLTIKAIDGKEGFDLALKERPDLILLDLMMPRVDGFEVSKRLKMDAATRHIPIVIFSALGNKNTEEFIKKLGAADFIEKPFEPDLLLDKINKILEGKNG